MKALAALLLLLVSQAAAAQSWWDPAWTARRKLDFRNTMQTQPLDDFTVLVWLTNSRINYARTQPEGQDLRFVDSDGTLLAHEIEYWNPAFFSLVWVRVPRVEAGPAIDFMHMYFGNPAAPPPAFAPGAVWDSDFAMVHHFHEARDGGAGAHRDRTANANHSIAIDAGSGPGLIGIGGGLVLDGGSVVRFADSPGLRFGSTDSFTLEAWVSTLATNGFILNKKASFTGGGDYQLWVDSNGSAAMWLYDDLGVFARPASTSAVNGGLWRYLAGTWDEGTNTASIYVDGVLEQTAVANLTTFSSPGREVAVGMEWDDNGGFGFLGGIDEVRISRVARNATWVQFQNLSMRDAYLTFGPLQNFDAGFDAGTASDGGSDGGTAADGGAATDGGTTLADGGGSLVDGGDPVTDGGREPRGPVIVDLGCGCGAANALPLMVLALLGIWRRAKREGA